MNAFIFTVVVLSALGGVFATVLYVVAQKFKVKEDPRIDIVESILPGANCGGCGSAGCHAFAERCVKEENLDSCFCPVGGNAVMGRVAEALGKTVEQKKPMVAVLRCNGSIANRPKRNTFDAYPSCAVSAALYEGETACRYGCLGFGDCVEACKFEAIVQNPQTGLIEINEDKCTACGACVKACPQQLIELRLKGPKDRRVFVACRNLDKGAAARKACKAACIGCGKCVKACAFDAITLKDNVAYIDFNKCRLCRKCVAACPTGAIQALHFPPLPPKPAAAAPAAVRQAEKTLKEIPITEKCDHEENV